MNGIMDGILYDRKRAEKAERERDEARAKLGEFANALTEEANQHRDTKAALSAKIKTLESAIATEQEAYRKCIGDFLSERERYNTLWNSDACADVRD